MFGSALLAAHTPALSEKHFRTVRLWMLAQDINLLKIVGNQKKHNPRQKFFF